MSTTALVVGGTGAMGSRVVRAPHPELAAFGDWLTTTGWDGAAGG
ncbi:hypothetical protein ACIQVO_35145 [Streptomyces sp. NPDC101062]